MTAAAVAAPLALKAVSYESNRSVAPVDGSTVSTTVPESPSSLRLPAGESGDRRGNIGPVSPESTTTETIYGSIGTPTSLAEPTASTSSTTPTTEATTSTTSSTLPTTSISGTSSTSTTPPSSTSTSTTTPTSTSTSTSTPTSTSGTSSTLPSTTPPAD